MNAKTQTSLFQCPQFLHHDLSFYGIGKVSFALGSVANCYLHSDVLIS